MSEHMQRRKFFLMCKQISNSKTQRLKEQGGASLTNLGKELEALPVSLLVLGTERPQHFLRG